MGLHALGGTPPKAWTAEIIKSLVWQRNLLHILCAGKRLSTKTGKLSLIEQNDSILLRTVVSAYSCIESITQSIANERDG